MGLCNKQPGSSSVYTPHTHTKRRVSFYTVGRPERKTSVAGRIIIPVYFIIFNQGTPSEIEEREIAIHIS